MSFLILLVSMLAAGGVARAEEGQGSRIAIMYGLGVLDAENTSQFRLTGVKGEFFFIPKWSIGGYYLVSNSAGSTSATGKFSYSLQGAQLTYHMPGTGGESYIALRVGLAKVLNDFNSQDVIFSPYHYGFASGYDYYVGSMLSLGFEGSYLHVERSKTIHNGGTVQFDSFNAISFMLTAQIRL